MAVRVIDPVGVNNAGLVIQGARQGQNFNIETPTVDGRPRKNPLRRFGAKGLEAALGVPNATRRE